MTKEQAEKLAKQIKRIGYPVAGLRSWNSGEHAQYAITFSAYAYGNMMEIQDSGDWAAFMQDSYLWIARYEQGQRN